jgi:NAD/NADP transhydrogenase alpha subunit
MASDKQIGYALALLAKAGYGTRFMDRTFKALGARMNQRSGTVRDWLIAMESQEISHLIDRLKQEAGGGAGGGGQ